MLSFDDARWTDLCGGYRVPFDPRPALRLLERNESVASAWHELWEKLHHQGDVDAASYAALPHLVRVHGIRRVADWNTYALAVVIEECRKDPRNPDLPAWLQDSYKAALMELVDLGLREFKDAKEPVLIDSIIAVFAIAKGRRSLARLASDYSEDERRELLEQH
jgi:hypothetical protein